MTARRASEDAVALLAANRWHEDMVVTNHDGERVWLKVARDDRGQRIGITDCCLEVEPCAHHQRVSS